ncbi:MAG: ribonuclease P protein component [Nitrospirae bacterium]|nr:ribonuclease P protein component [Nitrospirota bacterium]
MRSLTRKRDFESVFKAGIALASKYLVIYAKNNKFDYNRLGLSVSKKTGGAVKRNRIKRLLREAMRKLSGELPPNYDFVIVARRASAEGRLDDFIRDIKKFIKKLKKQNNFSLE